MSSFPPDVAAVVVDVVVNNISQLFLAEKAQIGLIQFSLIQDLNGDGLDGRPSRLCLHIAQPHRQDESVDQKILQSPPGQN